MKMDDWFKPAILILAAILLLIFYQYSKNGRYIFHYYNDLAAATLVDTRTGTVYAMIGDKYVKWDFLTGKMETLPNDPKKK